MLWMVVRSGGLVGEPAAQPAVRGDVRRVAAGAPAISQHQWLLSSQYLFPLAFPRGKDRWECSSPLQTAVIQ